MSIDNPTPTGPGNITADPNNTNTDPRRGPVRIAFFIDNFDIDGYDLKSEHRQYLDTFFRQNYEADPVSGLQLPRDRMWVFLRGYASRTGHSLTETNSQQSHNDWLSQQRVNAVKNYLRGYVSERYITSSSATNHVGDRYSNGPRAEDDRFRAVQIIITPIPNRPPPAGERGITSRFAIRATGGAMFDSAVNSAVSTTSAIADLPEISGLGICLLFIQIKKLSTQEVRNYVYSGLQASAGINFISLLTAGLSSRFSHSHEVETAINVTTDIIGSHVSGIVGGSDYGPWSNFIVMCRHQVQFHEFVGSASFGEIILGGSLFTFDSVNQRNDYLHIYSVDNNGVRDYSDNVIPLEIRTPPWERYTNLRFITLPAFGHLDSY